MTADFGPCDLWPVRWSCDVSSESPAATGMAVAAATRTLWALTGRQFGTCTTTLRLCREECWDSWPYDDWSRWTTPTTYGYGYLDFTGPYWYPAVCGSCTSGCSCGPVPEVRLPDTVDHIVTVKVDGNALPTGSYRLDNNRLLVRTDGGQWPRCNDLTKGDDQIGTWSVSAAFGQAVPVGGQLAAGELACELLKAMRGEDCRIPAGVTQLTRQGVSISIPDFGDILMHGRTGLYMCDMFIMSENPKHLQARGRVYNVDRPAPRRAGT
jgi:hypothetical protein